MLQIIALFDHFCSVWGWDRIRPREPQIHCCEPGWSWRVRQFSDFDLWLVLGGRGRLLVNGKAYPLELGSGFLLQPGDRVAGEHDARDPLTVFAWHWDVRNRGRGGQRFSENILHFQTTDLEWMRGICLHVVRGAARRDWVETMGPTYLGVLLAEFLNPRKPSSNFSRPDLLDRLSIEVRSSPGKEWNLPKMASACNLSTPHFCRKFRERFGTSPKRFVIRERIRRAGELLRESSLSIQEIADALGYTDVFFFHRQFRAETGKTPQQARGLPPPLTRQSRHRNSGTS